MVAVQRGGGNCLDSTITHGMHVPNRHNHTIVHKNAQLAQIDEESKKSIGRTWPSKAVGSFVRFEEVSGVTFLTHNIISIAPRQPLPAMLSTRAHSNALVAAPIWATSSGKQDVFSRLEPGPRGFGVGRDCLMGEH